MEKKFVKFINENFPKVVLEGYKRMNLLLFEENTHRVKIILLTQAFGQINKRNDNVNL